MLGGERPGEPPSLPQQADGDIVLEARGIRRVFGDVVANDGVDLTVRAGQIHALLGENGAGKTTLVKILYGVYTPDEGEIFLGGRKVDITSPRDARDMGIGMVHQHFMLAEPHTVAENLTLGLPGGRVLFPEQEVRGRIEEFSTIYGLKIDPDTRAWQLSAGEKQKIEILKTLLAGARIIILDEPTAVLTPPETEDLLSAMRLMTEQGKAIIFITHKLDEVLSVSDEVTVLRKGKVVSKTKTSDTNRRQLANLMVGTDLAPSKRKEAQPSGSIVLEVQGLRVTGDRGNEAVRDLTFDLKEGEILGLAGVAGNGQRELVEVLAGVRHADSGQVRILGRDVINEDPRKIASFGVAYIPEDRMSMGVVPELSVSENLVLRKHWQEPFSKGILLDQAEVESYANKMIADYHIMTPGVSTPVRQLSGGNIQRLVLAREISGHPRLIIASHPTSGLDVKAAKEIRAGLLQASVDGSSVLLDSEDLEEILELSDRIAAIVRGQFVGIVPREEADLERIGLMMGGADT
jgi:simple sugar transport system ATP-binding protein